MDLTRIFASFLLFFLPLVLPIMWWLVTPNTSAQKLLFFIFVVQLSIAAILFFLWKRSDLANANQEAQARYGVTEQFVSLYERSPMPYLTINRRGEVIMFNPATVNLFGTDTQSISGLNFLDLIIETNEKNDLSVLSGRITSGVTLKDEKIKLRTIKGDFKWVSMSVYTYEIKDQRLVSLVDITQEKIVDTAKSEFVALATHQLRTPISAIRWNLELLQKNMKETKTENQSRYLTKIERNTMRMIALINDFLSVSKLEMGTFASNIESINLTEFFTAILDEYAEKITEKNITIKRSDEPEGLVFDSDSRLLHIIVSNLMSNAVKYVESSGEVTLNFRLVDNKVFINIADNGIGVPEEEVGKLFAKFYRASNAQSHQAEGTGLGLYIVKQSVEKLGGKIEVVSGRDKGASFTVVLPYLKNKL